MKKIKLLFSILIALLVFNVFKVYTYTQNYELLLTSNDPSETYFFIFYVSTLALFFIAQTFAILGLWTFMKKSVFNNRASYYLRTGGALLTVFGVLVTSIRFYQLWTFREAAGTFINFQIISVVENGYPIILGLVLIILADIVKNGWIIKSENDLTI